MIKEFIKTVFLVDIFNAILLGIKCIFKKPVTKNLKDIKRNAGFRRYFFIDNSKCIGCKNCSSICPNRSIQIIDKNNYIFDKDKCAYCGLCQKACPKKAIKFKS
ncbi:MAG: 4Fe-4S binding protein [Holosporales bacterium]|jgi:formate hydrogenlyase subunit 6/NADH:ubiquinone oxidoreductase subunit I|nr:4Fe-4S binding protein [Holosporales bacterium]